MAFCCTQRFTINRFHSSHRHGHSCRYRKEFFIGVVGAKGCRLVGRTAIRFCAGVRSYHHADGNIPHCHRREPRSFWPFALSRPEHHGIVPHDDVRRGAALCRWMLASSGRNRASPGTVFRTVSSRASGRDRPPSRNARQGRFVRGTFDTLANPPPVRERAAPFQHRHEFWIGLRRCARSRSGRYLRRKRVHSRCERTFQGRLHDPTLWPAVARRAWDANGDRNARLYGRTGFAVIRKLAVLL